MRESLVMKKSEFKYALRGGYLFVVVFIAAIGLLFGATALLAHEIVLRSIALLLTTMVVGLLWFGYNRSFGCRTISFEGNCLVVNYRFGKRLQFSLPKAVENVVAYTHDQRAQRPDNLQLVLRDQKGSFLLNVSCFDDSLALLKLLEPLIPMSRRYSDGRVEPLELGQVKRGADFVDVVGKPDEVISKIGGHK